MAAHSTPTAIGDQIVAWRKARELSQREVAEGIGLDPGTLSRPKQSELGGPNRPVRHAIETLLRMTERQRWR